MASTYDGHMKTYCMLRMRQSQKRPELSVGLCGCHDAGHFEDHSCRIAWKETFGKRDRMTQCVNKQFLASVWDWPHFHCESLEDTHRAGAVTLQRVSGKSRGRSPEQWHVHFLCTALQMVPLTLNLPIVWLCFLKGGKTVTWWKQDLLPLLN